AYTLANRDLRGGKALHPLRIFAVPFSAFCPWFCFPPCPCQHLVRQMFCHRSFSAFICDLTGSTREAARVSSSKTLVKMDLLTGSRLQTPEAPPPASIVSASPLPYACTL